MGLQLNGRLCFNGATHRGAWRGWLGLRWPQRRAASTEPRTGVRGEATGSADFFTATMASTEPRTGVRGEKLERRQEIEGFLSFNGATHRGAWRESSERLLPH